MEAATTLRPPQVRTVGERLAIDGLLVDDPTVVRLARAREESGEDAAAVVVDALEIGARVLDREQAGANAEFVRTEFEKVSREVESQFGEQAGQVAQQLAAKVDEVFGAENGQLAKELERLFSDGSSAAVQNRVREEVAQALTRSREELLRQFVAGDGLLADFKEGIYRLVQQSSAQQHETQRALLGEVAAVKLEVQRLHAEREKQLELAVERERGTAKGRTFEEAVAAALAALAGPQGDDCDAVGDLTGAGGKAGDVVVAIDACQGPPRGRVVFEAKNSRKSKKEALAELDKALATRDAQFAVMVVPAEDKLPAGVQPLREHSGDKLFVVWDPEGDSTLSLELAYRLARARVMMARGASDGLDTGALRAEIERAVGAMEDVRRIKTKLTTIRTGADEARDILDAMANRVRAHLGEIDGLLAAAAPDDPEA